MSYEGLRVLVTAGPTQEPLDPVRYIGNRSSGKMGYALAEALVARGAEVILVSGPTVLPDPTGLTMHRVTTAQQMYEAAAQAFTTCDLAILSAAVADYRPAQVFETKIKKAGQHMTLELVKTVDIAEQLGLVKKEGQRLVGFSLETDNERENALSKLERKNFDAICLNSLREVPGVFGGAQNKVTVLTRTTARELPLLDKALVAQHVLDALAELELV